MKPITEKPGAGLPLLARFFLRYYIGPFVSKKFTWEKNADYFASETTKILGLINSLSEEELITPVLVPPLRGIEDSSRNWSIAMTLEHLLIVGKNISRIVESLGQDIVPPITVDIAAVKPPSLESSKCTMEEFKKFERQAHELLRKIQNRESTSTLPHPWFGNFNAQQWFWLIGAHQGLHRVQVEKIKAGLLNC